MAPPNIPGNGNQILLHVYQKSWWVESATPWRISIQKYHTWHFQRPTHNYIHVVPLISLHPPLPKLCTITIAPTPLQPLHSQYCITPWHKSVFKGSVAVPQCHSCHKDWYVASSPGPTQKKMGKGPGHTWKLSYMCWVRILCDNYVPYVITC